MKSKRGSIRIYIPEEVRNPLIFTIFFAIIGIIIQSILAGKFIFLSFFSTNYVTWFKSFGGFVERIQTPGSKEFFFSLLKSWYYFFYTGGLLALIWGILNWIINFEWKFGKSNKHRYQYYDPSREFETKKSIPKIEDVLDRQENG